jgi:hypothetical protein
MDASMKSIGLNVVFVDRGILSVEEARFGFAVGAGSASMFIPRSFHDSKARSNPVNPSLANMRCFAVANRSQTEEPDG